jgi:predicted MFS family arabinose efflux permease
MGGPWLVLAVTLAIQAFVSMAVLTVPAMAPAMAEALHVSPSLVGMYVASVYVGAIIASTLAGPLVVRFGALRVSQWGLIGCAVGMALLAISHSIPGALVSAVFTGLGYGPITPASSHVLARTAPPERVSVVFSIKQTGVPLGGVMAGGLVPPLVVAWGVDAALWSVAIACVICAVAAQPLRAGLDADRDPLAPVRAANLAAPIAIVARHRELSRLAAFSFVFSAIQMCLAAYLVTYLHTAIGYSLVAAGVAMSAAQGGGVVGRVLWGYVADKWFGARGTLAGLALLMAASAAAVAALHAGVPHALVLAIVVIFGASATGWNGVYLAEVARQAPAGQAGSATGGSLAITFLGVVLGPVLFGALSDAAGSYRVGYIALAVATAVCGWKLLRAPR